MTITILPAGEFVPASGALPGILWISKIHWGSDIDLGGKNGGQAAMGWGKYRQPVGIHQQS